MNKYSIYFLLIGLLLSFLFVQCKSQETSITQKNDTIQTPNIYNLQKASLFNETLEKTIKEVDDEIALGVLVPIPKDMAGGYSHERHKKNFLILQKAGDLFEITKDEKYAKYIRDHFMTYAAMYEGLPLHPTNKSYAVGKIFWQCLNDANWLVYCSQAYASVYDWLSADQRKVIETKLFRPMADFLSIDNPKFFNRIHNHSTWANAAVGMIGLVMKDEELIDRALYGIEDDGLDETMRDNDGGFIKIDGQNQAGFLAQLDFSFSPDGHFTEGPYYLRYAMTPFLLFARELAAHKTELNIYAYRDSIMKKSVYALLNETDYKGKFFPINDAQKGMSWLSREVVSAVDIAYKDFGQDPMLLSIASLQKTVLLDNAGYLVSQDLDKGLDQDFRHRSIAYRDGADGEKGGLGILRAGNDSKSETCLVMKYTAHGMGHGHFDRLSYSLYDEEGEVVQDYGAARWVNIDQKGGGRYLPENQSFAKQTIAHNTIIVNEASQCNGSVKDAEETNSYLYFFEGKDSSIKIVSAKDDHAYPGSKLHRSIFMIMDDDFRNPLVLDIFRVNSEQKNTYDLPLWYMGHLLSTDFEYTKETHTLNVLGQTDGYQHIWKEGQAIVKKNNAQFTWYGNGKFYTITESTNVGDELIFGRLGANDPNFNLRSDPVLIHRRRNTGSTIFASIIESHGKYNAVSEIPISPFSGLSNLEVLKDTEDYTVVGFSNKSKSWQVAIANNDANETAIHELKIGDTSIKWQGPYTITKQKK